MAFEKAVCKKSKGAPGRYVTVRVGAADAVGADDGAPVYEYE